MLLVYVRSGSLYRVWNRGDLSGTRDLAAAAETVLWSQINDPSGHYVVLFQRLSRNTSFLLQHVLLSEILLR